MRQSASNLTTKFVALFTVGGRDALCDHAAFPFPVQSGNRMMVCPTRGELMQVLTACLAGADARGPGDASAQIAAIELPRKGRFRVWVDWHCHVGGDQTLTVERMVCYCRIMADHVRIEMIACNSMMPARTAAILPRRKTA
jgi:hypothetical protein